MPKVVQQSNKVKRTTKTESILDRIRPIGFDPDDGIKMLLYGRSGTGKTTTWATFPKPILSVVVSGGRQPGELRSIDTAEYRKVIHQVELGASSELDELLGAMDDGQAPVDFKTIVLDHVTGLQDLVLMEVLGLEELPVAKTWGLASQQDYGTTITQCKEILRKMLSLSINVVIIGQERVFGSEESTGGVISPHIGVDLMPKLAGWLYPACDYICNTFIRPKEIINKKTVGQGKMAKVIETRVKTDEKEYCIRVGPDEIYTTKFRLPKGTPLPASIVVGKDDNAHDMLMVLIQGQPE